MKKKFTIVLSFMMILFVSFLISDVNASKVMEDYQTTNIAPLAEINVTTLDGSEAYFVRNDANNDHTGTEADLINGIASSWDGVEIEDSEGNRVIGWVTLDFKSDYLINQVLLSMWHDWGGSDVVLQLSTSEDFTTGVTTIYNNDFDNSLELGTSFNADNNVFMGEILDNSGNYGNSTEQNGNIWTFQPVLARYMRVTANIYGDAELKNKTILSEIQAFGLEYDQSPEKPNRVAPVLANKLSGDYTNNFTLELVSVYDDADIYYTTDGTYPTSSGNLYTEPINTADFGKSLLLRAIVITNDVSSLPIDLTYNFVTETSISVVGLDESILSTEKHEANSANDGSISAIIDGDYSSWGAVRLIDDSSNQVPGWIYIDLGSVYDVNQINVSFWHDWSFKDVVIQLSTAVDFSENVTTVYSNDSDNSLGLDIEPTSMDSNINHNEEYLSNHGEIGSGTDANGNIWRFETTPARYVRVIGIVSDSNPEYSVYTEIEVIKEEIVVEIENALVKVQELDEKVRVDLGTTIDTVLNNLPTLLTVTDSQNNTETLTGSWTSNSYDANTVGDYQFTFVADDLGSFVDPYNLLTTVISVQKIETEITITPLDKVYDGKAASLQVTTNADDYVVEYYQGDTLLDNAPINAGDYKVVIIVKDNAKFTTKEVAANFTVAKATPTLEDLTYIGEELFTSSSLPLAEAFSFNTIDGKFELNTEQDLEAGTNAYNWTFTPTDTVNYEIITGTVDLTVTEVGVENITVTPPTKTEYLEGEKFDTTGMVVTAHYNDGTSKEVTDYTVNKTKLDKDDKVVTVTYNGVSLDVEISVTANNNSTVIIIIVAAVAVLAIGFVGTKLFLKRR